jgi:hypothetical protein
MTILYGFSMSFSHLGHINRDNYETVPRFFFIIIFIFN